MNIRFEPVSILDVTTVNYCSYCSAATDVHKIHPHEKCILSDLNLTFGTDENESVCLNFKFYQCFLKNCAFNSLKQQELCIHLKSHGISLDRNQPYKCQSCSYSTTQRRYLASHKLTCHSEKENSIRNQTFSRVGKKGHQYSCPHCSYTTTQSRYLDNHIQKCEEAPAEKDGSNVFNLVDSQPTVSLSRIPLNKKKPRSVRIKIVATSSPNNLGKSPNTSDEEVEDGALEKPQTTDSRQQVSNGQTPTNQKTHTTAKLGFRKPTINMKHNLCKRVIKKQILSKIKQEKRVPQVCLQKTKGAVDEYHKPSTRYMNPKYYCGNCPFRSKKHHVYSHREKCMSGLYEEFRCKACMNVFKSSLQIKAHTNKCRNITVPLQLKRKLTPERAPAREMKCDNCNYATVMPCNLLRHKQSSLCGRFSCSVPNCNFQTYRRYLIQGHHREVHGKNSATQPVKKKLLKEYKEKEKQDTFSCQADGCNFSTKFKAGLLIHNARKHGKRARKASSSAGSHGEDTKGKLFTCNLCSFKCSSTDSTKISSHTANCRVQLFDKFKIQPTESAIVKSEPHSHDEVDEFPPRLSPSEFQEVTEAEKTLAEIDNFCDGRSEYESLLDDDDMDNHLDDLDLYVDQEYFL